MSNEAKEKRYINPYTDFGFKKLFGTEMNKDLLISFLNALLKREHIIKDIKYLPTEHLGILANRRAIFDVYCEDEEGGKFIVEMQNVSQQYYKDRSVFYSTFPIQEQAKVGEDWDFNLKDVYTVGILNFEFRDDEYSGDCYHHELKLMDTQTKKVFYDKLTYIYIEMPKFNKTEDELETMFDKWLFVLRNLSRLFERPKALQEKVFKKLFEQAEIARFTPEERRVYEDSVKVYRDINNAINSAKAESWTEGMTEGMAKGKAEANIENARRMKAKGFPWLIYLTSQASRLKPSMLYSHTPIMRNHLRCVLIINKFSMNYLCSLLSLFGIFASNPLFRLRLSEAKNRSSLRFGGLEVKSARK